MADYGLFIGWGALVRGRELKGLEVFNESIQFWADHQKKGNIESFEPVLLTPHGGDLAGFLLIKGEGTKLGWPLGKAQSHIGGQHHERHHESSPFPRRKLAGPLHPRRIRTTARGTRPRS